MESNDTLRRSGVTAHHILRPKILKFGPMGPKKIFQKIVLMKLVRYHMFIVCNLKDKVVFEAESVFNFHIPQYSPQVGLKNKIDKMQIKSGS